DHLEPLVLILPLHLLEPRNLDLARPAPRGPEIQQHHLAAIIAEVHYLAIGILQREIRSRLALVVRFHRSRPHRARGRTPFEKVSQDQSAGEQAERFDGWTRKRHEVVPCLDYISPLLGLYKQS